MKLTSRTYPASMKYLSFIYKSKEYQIEDFYKRYYRERNPYKIEKLLEKCTILYKGVKFSFDGYVKSRNAIGDKLTFCKYYSANIFPNDFSIFLIDRDYYAASKLFKSAENQLHAVRYYIIKAFDKIDYNVNLHWNTGYTPIYIIRTLSANSAIMWLNNIFDSMMQIIFISLRIYKKHPQYQTDLDFFDVLKLCDYKYLSDFYGANKNISHFKDLWKILSRAQTANLNINKWANYLKHKGGIEYIGVNPETPYEISLKESDGSTVKDSEFSTLSLDLDVVIEQLTTSYIALVNELINLGEFLQFESLSLNSDGTKIVTPERSSYCKVIIP
jgi:hypothetical protein